MFPLYKTEIKNRIRKLIFTTQQNVGAIVFKSVL